MEIKRQKAKVSQNGGDVRMANGRWPMVKSIFDLRRLISGVCALFFVLCCSALPASALPKKIARIGLLANTIATSTSDMKPFYARLTELGYVQGQSYLVDARYFNAKTERLPELAAELVRLKPDVIVVIGNEAIAALKRTTKDIPIVMTSASEAVRSGFVASLARPGSNITGLTSMGADIMGKRLELLQEINPKLTRVGFLWTPSSPVAADNLKETEAVARALKVQLLTLEAKNSADNERAFQTAANTRADALLIEGGAFFTAHQSQLIELARKYKMSTSYPNTRYVEAGGLLTYGLSRPEQFRRAADFVDKILKGAKPADLPVERPTKFELVINLKAAKQIGLTIPPNVLARADRVIK